MKKTYSSLLILIFLLNLSACYEPAEGCLDSFASNYDVTADNSCDDCCVLPQLSASVFYSHDSLNLDTIFYSNPEGLSYQVLDFFMCLHNVELQGVNDTYSVIVEEGETLEIKDLAITSLEDKNISIGSIKIVDTLETISASIGLPDAFKCILSESRNIDVLDYLYKEEEFNASTEKYYESGIDFVIDSVLQDTFRVRFEFNAQNLLKLNKNLESVVLTRGDNYNVSLELKFDQLFKNILVVDTEDEELLKEKLLTNFADFIN